MYKRIFKRIIDFTFALIAILVFSPILIPITIGLLLTGEHYVFYFQKRIGYKNKTFYIWKFATMLKSSPTLGTGSITLKNDWRLTPLGKYLRGSKINEIPQLINILKGEMSIIGPRPLMQVDFNKFTDSVKNVFYDCKPGLTGIASIIFRDEEKLHSETIMDPHVFDKNFIAPYKGELEIWYQKNIGFITDLKLFFCTIWVVLFPESNLPYKIFKDLPSKPKELKVKEKEK